MLPAFRLRGAVGRPWGHAVRHRGQGLTSLWWRGRAFV